MPKLPQAIDVFLHPGEHFVGDAGYRISTLLGSCVSVTLWHQSMKVGAMSHFLLSARQRVPRLSLDGRYGEEALWLMLAELTACGVPPSECRAKIFGGGDMFPEHRGRRSIEVGRQNGEAARRLLRSHRIPIVAESLFGVGHRKILFDIATGDVWTRLIKPAGLPSAQEPKP